MIQSMTFNWDASAAQDPLFEVKIPVGMTIVAVSYCPQSYTGTPTNSSIDIMDDGADVIAAAVTVATAGAPGYWRAKPVGGTNTPVHIAATHTLGVTLNFSGGSTPTAVDANVTIWYIADVL